MRRYGLLGLGVATAFFVAATPAAGQFRRPLLDSGPVVIIGTSYAESCYHAALAQDRSKDALDTCDSAFRGPLSQHNRVATLVNRSIVRNARGDFEGALADLGEAAERAPELAEVPLNTGDVYLRMRRWRDAEDAFTDALALGPRQPHIAYFGRAIAREELDDAEGAYADYMAAAEAAPGWRLPREELARFQVVANGGGGA